jgi:glycosyltransferase involved in cell wall biosynthesis
VGDSARFRTDHVAEWLGKHGLRSSITVQDNPFLPGYAKKFSVFVFHRTLFTPSVTELVRRVKARGGEIVFETDDLVYDPAFLRHMDYWRVMNPLERKLYENGVGGEILADPDVRIATTSTPFLAGKLAERGKRVFLVRNRLSETDVKRASELFGRRDDRKGSGDVTIGYFSGSRGHDKDFATVTVPLLRIMERYPETRLFVAGPLVLDDAFAPFADRIDRVAYAPRKEHFRNLSSIDIDIAPLEVGNPFCEGKSELKFFEAGIVGVPTVAAGTGTFRNAIEDGKDGFVAGTDAEWEEKLGRLVSDALLRKSMGEAARATALARYTTEGADDSGYVDFLKEAVRRVAGRTDGRK